MVITSRAHITPSKARSRSKNHGVFKEVMFLHGFSMFSRKQRAPPFACAQQRHHFVVAEACSCHQGITWGREEPWRRHHEAMVHGHIVNWNEHVYDDNQSYHHYHSQALTILKFIHRQGLMEWHWNPYLINDVVTIMIDDKPFLQLWYDNGWS